MAELTKAQRAVLSRMAAGDEVWTTPAPNPSTFWHGNLNDRAPSFATLNVLEKRGAIINLGKGEVTGRKYRITEAGRAALASATDAEGA